MRVHYARSTSGSIVLNAKGERSSEMHLVVGDVEDVYRLAGALLRAADAMWLNRSPASGSVEGSTSRSVAS